MDAQELIAQLREYASNPGYSHNDYADTMRQAADTLAERAVSPAESVQSIDSPTFKQIMDAWVAAWTPKLPQPTMYRNIVTYIDAQMVKDHNRGYKAAHAEGRRSALEELHPQWLKEKERADRAETEHEWRLTKLQRAYDALCAARQAPDLSKLVEYERNARGSDGVPPYAIETFYLAADVQALLAQPLQQEGGKDSPCERGCRSERDCLDSDQCSVSFPMASDNLQQASTAQKVDRDAVLESAVQAVADRVGDADRIMAVNAYDAIRSLKSNRLAPHESTAQVETIERQAYEAMEKDRDSYKRMFEAACVDLGLINEKLGLDPDDGGADPILDAIDELRAERNQWVDAGYAVAEEATLFAAQAEPVAQEQIGWGYETGGRIRFADMGDTTAAGLKLFPVYRAAPPQQVDHGITVGPKFEIKVLWGHYDQDGYWYPNLNLSMSEDEQRQQNEKSGYKCTRRPQQVDTNGLPG